jgi:DNA-binding transcriptional LysR family regulator
MNLRRLEYFMVLGRTGNLRRAGELLGVSAPALSKAMKVLEDESGVRLWARDGRRIILTDPGKRLLKRAPALVEELKTLLESLSSPASGARPARIGTFEVFSTYFLRFLDRLGWTDRPLELHELLPGEVERHLTQGDIDYGITYLPVPDPDLDFLKVASIEMGVFIRKGSFKGVSQPDVPFVVPVQPLQTIPTKVRGLDGWPEDAYRRKVLHQVTLMESALELCRQGRVAGYFPVFVVEEHNRRVRQEFRLERKKSPYSDRVCKADVFLVKRKSDEENSTVRELAKAIRLVCT